MNFVFDPLENILSESSDDSFFGRHSKAIAKNTKSMAATNAGHKSDMGAKTTAAAINSDTDIVTGFPCKISAKMTTDISTQPVQNSSIVANQSGLKDEIVFELKKPKTGKLNISNLFGDMEPEKFSRQSTETTDSTTHATYTKPGLRPKVASDKQFASSLDDPLGFFTCNKEKQKHNKHHEEILKLAEKSEDVATGFEAMYKKKKEINAANKIENHAENFHPTYLSKTGELESVEIDPIEMPISLNGLRLAEAQLLLATQMRIQEKLLHEMRNKQDCVFLYQKAQFDSMLKKQASRKKELENAIRLQEERIKFQLETLTSVPTLETSFSKVLFASEETTPYVDMGHFKDELKKLKDDNQQLANFLINIVDSHRKEMELMEESYKKHIKLFEKNLQGLAAGPKDNEKNSVNENATFIQGYNKKLKDFEEDHHTSIINLRKHYDAKLEMLQKDNRLMTEQIQDQFKSLESLAKFDKNFEGFNATFIDLKDMLKEMRVVVNEIVSTTGKDLNQREAKLLIQEKEIEGRENRLHLLETCTQAEHSKLLELVRSLKALLRNFQEGSTKDIVDLLHTERLSLNRERELFFELVEKTKRHIQESQKLQEADKTFYMRQIQEEWRLLNNQREKLGSNMQYDNEIPRFDLCSNCKDSKDPKSRIDARMEESKSCADMMEFRNWGRVKGEFLERIQHLKLIERQAQESLQRTLLTEKRFNSNILILKEQMKNMTVREARLSKGRFELAQSHLQLENASNNVDCKVCRTCKTVFENHPSHNNFERKFWAESFFNANEIVDRQ